MRPWMATPWGVASWVRALGPCLLGVRLGAVPVGVASGVA